MNSFKAHPKTYFIILVFVISAFLFIGPMLLVGIFGVSDWFMSLGEFAVSWAPNIAAIILLGFSGGPGEINKLLTKFIQWRLKLRFYLIPIAFPIVVVLMIRIFFGCRSDIPWNAVVSQDFGFYSIFLIAANHFFRGPLGEEAGWRGFLLSSYMHKYSVLKSTLFVGVIWSVWHFPYWYFMTSGLFPDEPIRAWQMFISLAIVVFPMSIIMGWLYKKSNGSLIPVVLFHFFWNFSNELIDIPKDFHFMGLAILYSALAFLLVVWNFRYFIDSKACREVSS